MGYRSHHQNVVDFVNVTGQTFLAYSKADIITAMDFLSGGEIIKFLREETSVAIMEKTNGDLILSSGRNHRNATERVVRLGLVSKSQLIEIAREIEENDI